MNRSVADCAQSLVGIPFRHRGRTRRGLDCAGLVWLARKMSTGIVKDDRAYPPRPTSQMVIEKISAHATRIQPAVAVPGDVVVLRFGSFATHLGILTRTTIVHAVPSSGVIESDRATLAKGGHLIAAFRLGRA